MERSEAISKETRRLRKRDRHVAALLAMTQPRHFHSNDLLGLHFDRTDNCRILGSIFLIIRFELFFDNHDKNHDRLRLFHCHP